MDFNVLNVEVQEIMDEASLRGTKNSKHGEPSNAPSNNAVTPGPIISTKYMN